jgi:rod shape-determining protein MreC
MGGVFPPGYPVAQVSKVKRAGTTFALVEARPTAKLDRAREVLLVWFKALPVAPEPDTKASAAVQTPPPAKTKPAVAPAASAPAANQQTASGPGAAAADAGPPQATPASELPAPSAPAGAPAEAPPTAREGGE